MQGHVRRLIRPIALGIGFFIVSLNAYAVTPTATTIVNTTFSKLKTYHSSCSSTKAYSDSCFSAINAYCRASGYTTGFGPVEHSGDSVDIVCLPSSTAKVIASTYSTLKSYHSSCTTTRPYGDACNSAINAYCQKSGDKSGFGPTDHYGDAASIACVSDAVVIYSTYSTLKTYHSGCTTSSSFGDSCNAAINRFCRASGYVAGFGPTNHSGDYAHVACIPATVTPTSSTGFFGATSVRLSTTGMLSFNNAHNIAVSGDNVYVTFSGTDADIYVAKSSDRGVSWLSPVKVATSSTISMNSSVAIGPNGEVHVAWREQTSTGYEIFYATSVNGGVSFGSAIQVSSTTKADYPDIAADGSSVYSAWMDTSTRKVHFRRSINSGASWDSAIAVSNCAPKDAERPSLLVGKDKTLHMVWYDWCDGNSKIFHAYSTDGGVQWSAFNRITDGSAPAGHAYLIQDDQGSFHLVYVKGSKPYLNVYYRSSSDGVNWGNEIRIDSEATNAQAQHPKIAYSSGNLVIVWFEQSSVSYYYKLSSDGGVSWGSPVTLRTNKSVYASPDIVSDASGSFHAIWEDDRDGQRGIYYSRAGGGVFPGLLNPGSPSTANYSTSINTSGYTEKAPSVSLDGKELYFFSDRVGKMELYRATRSSVNDAWSTPSAIVFKNSSGAAIVTSTSNEYGPFVAELSGKKLLFFASDGSLDPTQANLGSGSCDIYVSIQNTDGSFGQPKNLGSKVNTADGEIGPSIYYDPAKNMGILVYSVGWTLKSTDSNAAHKAAFPQYASYLGNADENVWFNTFSMSGDTFVFNDKKFFKYNTVAGVEDNPEISNDGKLIFYNGAVAGGQTAYSDLPYGGDFDIFYTYLESDAWKHPVGLGGGLASSGHDGNPALLLINGMMSLFITWSEFVAGKPYQFDLYEYNLGPYDAPASNTDVFSKLPEM